MKDSPAFSPASRNRTILGLITSKLPLKDRNYLLRLQSETVVTRCLFVQKPRIRVPEIGEIWEFSGEDDFSEENGHFFSVKTKRISLPSHGLLPLFLSHHVPGLTKITAKEIQIFHGKNLRRLLEEKNVFALARLPNRELSFHVAEEMLHSWQKYVLETKLAHSFLPLETSPDILQKIVQCYGNDAFERITSDPYRLLSFTDFPEADDIARECFNFAQDDSRRLAGIALAASHQLLEQGIRIFNLNIISKAICVFNRIENRLTDKCIQAALNANHIIQIDANFFQCFGTSSIDVFIVERLISRFPQPVLSGGIGYSPDYADKENSNNEVGLFGDHYPLALLLGPIDKAIEKIIRVLSDSFHYDVSEFLIITASGELATCFSRHVDLKTVSCSTFLESNYCLDSAVKAVFIIGSSINHTTFARLLGKINISTRLVIAGDPVRASCSPSCVLSDLMGIETIPKIWLKGNLHDEPDLAVVSNLSLLSKPSPKFEVYNPRDADRPGTFFALAVNNKVTSAVGIQYQLNRTHRAIIICHEGDSAEASDMLLLNINDTDLRNDPIDRAVSNENVLHTSQCEHGQFHSVVVIIPNDPHVSCQWLHVAISTATTSAVLVGDPMALDRILCNGPMESKASSSLRFHWTNFSNQINRELLYGAT